MATNTYVALQTTTLTGSEGGVTFTSIPQGYTDLRIVYSGTGSTTIPFALRFNGDSGSNYSYTILYGTGSSAASTRGTSQTEAYNGNVWTDQNTIIVDLMNYSNSTTYKTAISRANSAGNRVASWVSLWRNTAAITEILVTATGGGTYQAGSTFTIYGIAAQAVASTAKATGGTITYDAFGNVVHTFTTSGTFTPSQALDVEYLVIAGGGGGGGGYGAGGGAGGYLESSSYAMTPTAYSIQVGSGGAGGSSTNGATGTNSYIGSVIAYGGGYGAGPNTPGSRPGGAGGSGGGAGYANGTAGAATPSGQGYPGGTGPAGFYGGAGGGGAGGPGQVGASQANCVGGLGRASVIDGVVRASGGSGYSAAATTGGGGSGNGGSIYGVANTGGGGGTENNGPVASGGNGGSGIVIIRYKGV